MLQSLDSPLASSYVLKWSENANMRNDTELETAILDYIECNFHTELQQNEKVISQDIINKTDEKGLNISQSSKQQSSKKIVSQISKKENQPDDYHKGKEKTVKTHREINREDSNHEQPTDNDSNKMNTLPPQKSSQTRRKCTPTNLTKDYIVQSVKKRSRKVSKKWNPQKIVEDKQ